MEERLKDSVRTGYLVLEKSIGGSCWTVACKDNGFPAYYYRKDLAEKMAAQVSLKVVGPKNHPMEAYIAEIKLPHKETK